MMMLADIEPTFCRATYIGGPLDGDVDEWFGWHREFMSDGYIVAANVHDEDDDVIGIGFYSIEVLPSDGVPALRMTYMGMMT